MKILFSNATHDWGGEKSWALETALCLTGRGHRCLMLGRAGDRWVDECRRAGLESRGLRFGPGIFNPLGVVAYHREARRFAPACMLVNINRDLCAGAVAGARLGIPVVRHVGLARDLNDDPVDRFLHRRWLRGTVAVGHQMKREMLERYPWLAPEHVFVVHIGKNTRVFRPGRQGEVRRACGVPDDALLVGVTSQLERHKGHAALLEAMAKLGRPDVHLAIAGRGPCRDELARRAEALGMTGRVHFLGFRRDLPDLLRNLDLFALPSLSEGFPNTLVEAMACGLPCVATDLACVHEVLAHGTSGLLVPPDDPGALCAALGRLLGDAAERARLGAAARAAVERSFSLEATSERLLGYLERVVAAAP